MALSADLAALRLTLPIFAELLTVRNALIAADVAALEALGSRRVLPAADSAAAEASRLGELR
jgi:hypothetical protein